MIGKACVWILCWMPVSALAGEPVVEVDDASTRLAIQNGLGYLLGNQNDDGSFGGHKNATYTSSFGNPHTYHCWQVGTSALATQALIELGGDGADEAAWRGLSYLIENARLRRPAEWDLDNNWGLIYGVNTLAVALRSERYVGTDREVSIREAATTMLEGLKRYQSARGGWGYYANPDAGWRPDWSTSFTTAAGVLALIRAKEAGLPVDEKMLTAAVRAVERARLPTGAYKYDVSAVPRPMRMESIDQTKGSLGRIQICNYALREAGKSIPDASIEEGVDQFFRYHRFLDVARNKPIPHEAYYANAAYFYLFGHYYAAFTIGEMAPEKRRESYLLLRQHIMKCQQKDGSMWDFWIADNTKVWGTAFGILGLSQSLDEPTRE